MSAEAGERRVAPGVVLRWWPVAPRSAEEVYRELDPRLRPVLLESRGPDAALLGRWDLVAWAPSCLVRAGQAGAERWEPSGYGRVACPDPLGALAELVRARSFPRPDDFPLPFVGGAIGVCAYELGRSFERLPGRAREDLGLPWLEWACYERAWLADRATGKAWRLTVEAPWTAPEEPWLEVPRPVGQPQPAVDLGGGLGSTFSRAGYLEAVRTVQDWIRRGHIYQANLSQRFRADGRRDPGALYARLRALQPMPFLARLPFGGAELLSASPERFLSVSGGRVETWPIKGTRPRGVTPAEDAARAAELRASPKDDAELAMIVDLHRNDLGRVCAWGSVEVLASAALQSFPSVHHLVARIAGSLRPEHDVFDLLRAAFPAGSITGAPKIRAEEIIDSLEPVARSAYTGSIGYIGYDGGADLNVAIRTLLVLPDCVLWGAGGAVTADSDPDEEYEETRAKVRGLWEALG